MFWELFFLVYLGMFDLLDDLAKLTGSVIGTVTGSIVGVSRAVISATLGITLTMVDEAIKAGCSTYEEIKDFHKL